MNKYLARAKQKARRMPQRKDKKRAARSLLSDLRLYILTSSQKNG